LGKRRESSLPTLLKSKTSQLHVYQLDLNITHAKEHMDVCAEGKENVNTWAEPPKRKKQKTSDLQPVESPYAYMYSLALSHSRMFSNSRYPKYESVNPNASENATNELCDTRDTFWNALGSSLSESRMYEGRADLLSSLKMHEVANFSYLISHVV
jgi:hypothetical protein